MESGVEEAIKFKQHLDYFSTLKNHLTEAGEDNHSCIKIS